jgi:hypothetical protein
VAAKQYNMQVHETSKCPTKLFAEALKMASYFTGIKIVWLQKSQNW